MALRRALIPPDAELSLREIANRFHADTRAFSRARTPLGSTRSVAAVSKIRAARRVTRSLMLTCPMRDGDSDWKSPRGGDSRSTYRGFKAGIVGSRTHEFAAA